MEGQGLAAGNSEMIPEQEWGPKERKSRKEENSNKEVSLSESLLTWAGKAASCWRVDSNKGLKQITRGKKNFTVWCPSLGTYVIVAMTKEKRTERWTQEK